MKTSDGIKGLMTSPIAVGVAAVHWMVVLFAIYGEEHSQPFHAYYEPLLTQWLIFLNLPALALSCLFSLPPMLIFGGNTLTLDLAFLIGFVFITWQWLIVGKLVGKLINYLTADEVNYSLIDD